MASIEEIKAARLEKLELLKKAGMNPYPVSSRQDYPLNEVIVRFDEIAAENKPVTLVGRVVAFRSQGGLVFFNFEDGTSKFQGLARKEDTEEKALELLLSTVDVGDFVEVTGTLFITKRGEKTLLVKNWQMLSKSLLPLPEKWHGLQDVEERFRKRYLDTIASSEVKNRFIMRSKVITEIRSILNTAGFLEVETPALQPIAGGTNALPFKTHHNALDMDLYLRIAPELYLKRLLVGGFPKVYEIGRNFRNEGIDVTHNPEFTMLEYYESYSDASKQMVFVENMIRTLVEKLYGKQSFEFEGETIDVSKKFDVISYFDLVKERAGIPNPETISQKEIAEIAQKHGVKVDKGDSVEKIMDGIYKKLCRPKSVQPTFLTKYPVNMLPLAKRDEKNPNVVDAFQIVMGGVEIVKAFSELNDPIDQRQRFEVQEENKKAGDTEAQSYDREFVEALEHGMPPAGGVGIGIDRLTMLLTNTKNIKEVILFPTMRPR